MTARRARPRGWPRQAAASSDDGTALLARGLAPGRHGGTTLATLPVRADAPPEAVELPAVPASVDPRGRRSPSPLAAGTVSIAPGETKALVVSAGNVNRIVTPFAQPDIVTTSPDQFTVRQNVVYAAPAAGDPLTLYITEKGDETRAISLILMPQVNVPAASSAW